MLQSTQFLHIFQKVVYSTLCNLQEQLIIENVDFPQKIFASTQLISPQIRFPSHTLLTDERHERIMIMISSSMAQKL